MLIQDLSATKRKFFLTLVQKRVKSGTGSGINFLSQRTWNNPVTDLKSILKQAPFVVVGGIATRMYMPERMTLDIDILIKAENSSLIYQDLKNAGAKKVGKLSIGGSQWQLADTTSLDVLEGEDSWVEEALSHPNYAPDGLPIISLPYLILMKLSASRTQDLADISRMLGLAKNEELNQIREVIINYLPTAQEDLESLIMLGKLEMDN
ncbi:hypothetical protein H6G11_11985 [Cyanobacterium aponinum FACHB-4101]|uniref:hypothetical protein n=1 Tax=Cyanobacterium aponinum TaxID=379064 RepID=UPI0016815E72|nr:hypothetical protein [Cyanobacterium aponinum]MBD2394968.1 hypothetical protein [Cyanobacterium aponinum FACHB-4101]